MDKEFEAKILHNLKLSFDMIDEDQQEFKLDWTTKNKGKCKIYSN
jgi:hypothetical protein